MRTRLALLGFIMLVLLAMMAIATRPAAPSEGALLGLQAQANHAIAQHAYKVARRIDDIGWTNDKAILWYERAARRGHAAAQYELGARHTMGWETEEDKAEARHWLERAAEQGHKDAQYNLGVFHAEGLGTPQNYRQAAHWYAKAAEQGHAKAQYNLGLAHASGEGVEQDEHKAAALYLQAATQGHAEAINNLGIAYLNGLGVPQDPVVARALYHLSLTLDDAPENKAHLNLDASTELLSKAQQEVADQLALRMRQTANLGRIIDAYLE